MRKKIVAGNWKMNKTAGEAVVLIGEILDLLKIRPVTEPLHRVVIAPPFIALTKATEILKGHPYVFLGAQNCYSKPKGAFTGEIAPAMLVDAGCEYVIIGHSERRSYFKENDTLLMEKVKIVMGNKLIPIFCCGELLSERETGKQYDIVRSQLGNTIFNLSREELQDVVIAYEPVWAIGTGVNATPEQAQDMHAFIRKLIAEKYDSTLADEMTLLYGGSCNAANAAELFSQPDVDGGLIGGASLIAKDFVEIIHAL
ncbi:MAG: Bifunctional PGK [Bacteroidetes bacterium ADurb.Bin408]|nr:MAG: Bifunctional PGK [Bacteroidetes bacterium ADurb.Bin408]